MKLAVVGLFVTLALTHAPSASGQTGVRVVLPSPSLLRCSSSNCSQIWPESIETKDIFPKQVIIDFDNGCVYGFTALYDKSVPVDQIKSAIDQLYGQWAVRLAEPLHVWRVEPRQFAIQLGVADKNEAKRGLAEIGTRQVIFIAFSGKSACHPSGQ